MFGRIVFSGEQHRERVVDAVPSDVGAGGFDGVADASFGGEAAGFDAGTEVNGDLDVAELHRGGYPVDFHVRRTERGPQVVRVAAEPGRGLVGFGEERGGVGAVVAA
ncbi:hypothetical protein [Lentzea indica]|uniref:hypothetical protein n=1 Tax=Lentzea indica TaxID=2604800 RepID=UPI001FE41792|nr:hypothetical protein [Lentzea indica]